MVRGRAHPGAPRRAGREPKGVKPAFDPEVFKARFKLLRRGDTLTDADRARLDELDAQREPAWELGLYTATSSGELPDDTRPFYRWSDDINWHHTGHPSNGRIEDQQPGLLQLRSPRHLVDPTGARIEGPNSLRPVCCRILAPQTNQARLSMHGLVAESIWHEVASEIDAGLGLPVRVEGHDWSVTDPGGDGLTVYETSDGGFCFRLWESKHHGTNKPVRRTVNAACTQVQSRALPYLSRFSLIAQQITDDDALARFYGALAERWVDRDPAAGVGISVGTDSNANVSDCFGKVDTYFEMELDQHQAQLHLMADYAKLADRVRKEIWKGCGLWTEP